MNLLKFQVEKPIDWAMSIASFSRDSTKETITSRLTVDSIRQEV